MRGRWQGLKPFYSGRRQVQKARRGPTVRVSSARSQAFTIFSAGQGRGTSLRCRSKPAAACCKALVTLSCLLALPNYKALVTLSCLLALPNYKALVTLSCLLAFPNYR